MSHFSLPSQYNQRWQCIQRGPRPCSTAICCSALWQVSIQATSRSGGSGMGRRRGSGSCPLASSGMETGPSRQWWCWKWLLNSEMSTLALLIIPACWALFLWSGVRISFLYSIVPTQGDAASAQGLCNLRIHLGPKSHSSFPWSEGVMEIRFLGLGWEKTW